MKKILLLAFIISAVTYAENVAEVTLGKTYVESINGFEENLQNTPKNIQVITQNEIEEKNYKDVYEILENSPPYKSNFFIKINSMFTTLKFFYFLQIIA